ncbi:unnamed protein product [Rhizoctonia solani]|uniref:DUF6533 domain-containing protein n=1 Tax=Rhizoctonia solani TaxID=456999 RepID=A0A8H3E7A3_9AGAM|nr:unnamed protein product [Rhizoctonia solani]
MELPREVLLWLGPSLAKRSGASAQPNPIQSLIEALEALRLAKYLIVAVFAFSIYDIVLTYSREVQHIWGSRWTLVRILFTIARYLVPCILMHTSITGLGLMGSKVWHPDDLISIIRLTESIYRLWMLAILLLVFASSQFPPALLIGKTIQKLEVIDNPLPGLLTGCVTTSSSSASTRWVQLFFSSLTYESTLFLLTVARAWSLNRRGVGTPIMILLTRDGAWYFLVAIASVGLTAAGTSIPKTQMAALLSQFFIAMMSCTCCRLLLRLRGFYTPTDQSTRSEGMSHSQQDGISMQCYTPRQNKHLAPFPVSSKVSLDRALSKLPV